MTGSEALLCGDPEDNKLLRESSALSAFDLISTEAES